MITSSTLMQICMAVLCMSTIGLHLARKNRNEALLYGVQSLAVVALLVSSLVGSYSTPLLIVAAVTLLIKVILAPVFFMRLVKRHGVKFTASTYANMPETIAALVVVLILANSGVFEPLANIVPANHTSIVLALAAMFASIMLMVNRRGALSQIVGVLSIENCIVVFAVLAGLEQSAVLQAGIIFDISVWLIVAVTMVSLVYKHHGSFDTSKMKNLRH